ncbi:MAG TPA: hypothetical protein VMV81_09920 [Phycisphaerae bacterium]|nr:hypothetical protein [Phycisphaerae bacterium]
MWKRKLVLLVFALATMMVATTGATCFSDNPDCDFFCFGDH